MIDPKVFILDDYYCCIGQVKIVEPVSVNPQLLQIPLE
jgi:hypothetical protein